MRRESFWELFPPFGGTALKGRFSTDKTAASGPFRVDPKSSHSGTAPFGDPRNLDGAYEPKAEISAVVDTSRDLGDYRTNQELAICFPASNSKQELVSRNCNQKERAQKE